MMPAVNALVAGTGFLKVPVPQTLFNISSHSPVQLGESMCKTWVLDWTVDWTLDLIMNSIFRPEF